MRPARAARVAGWRLVSVSRAAKQRSPSAGRGRSARVVRSAWAARSAVRTVRPASASASTFEHGAHEAMNTRPLFTASSVLILAMAVTGMAAAQSFGDALKRTAQRAVQGETQRKVDELARDATRCALGDKRCARERSEEHTSELQSLMRISYAVFCLKKNN